MATLNPFVFPGKYMHEANMRALPMLRSLGIELRPGFYATDIPNIQLVDLTKGDNEPVNINDFKGTLKLGNGLLVSHQSPFHADGMNLTIVRWGTGPGQCGSIDVHDSVALSECNIISYVGVRVERGVMFGPSVTIMDCDGSPADPQQPRGIANMHMAPVVIEHTAWIGSNAIIMPGVTIGHHATVSTSAVVNKDVPPHSLVLGNPAVVAARFVD